MAAVREVALGIRAKYGVKLAGWYYSDVGELNKVVHIWAFRDHDHMKEAKAQVAADPDWTGKYIPRVGGLIQSFGPVQVAVGCETAVAIPRTGPKDSNFIFGEIPLFRHYVQGASAHRPGVF